jgi:hypothetical protein
MKILQTIDPPESHRLNNINDYGRWYTWSDQFREFIRVRKSLIELLGKPVLHESIYHDKNRSWHPWYQAGGPTYTITESYEQTRDFFCDLLPYAMDIVDLSVGTSITLLSGMAGDDLSWEILPTVLASIRDIIAKSAEDSKAALYVPLGTRGPLAGEFPLHADLYGPNMLFNIFQDVPNDQSGASIFLPLSLFKEIIKALPEVDVTTQDKILATLAGPVEHDRFSEFYHLLHHPAHKWVAPLESAMKAKQLCLKMDSGQGYIINDHKWLHGRLAPNGGVSENRVHRLIYRSTTL